MSFPMTHGVEGEWPAPGQWVRQHPCGPTDAIGHPEIKAFACCPKGHTGSIVNHSIAADGTVSPSYLCHRADCGFHEFVKLEGWT